VNTASFHWDAIQWLREEAGLATDARPADRIGDPHAPLLVEGFLVRPSRAGTYAYASLWVFTCAALLAMLGMPGLSPTTARVLHRAGDVGLVVAAGLLLAAWVTARRSRDPALVQLHPSSAPATVESVAALHERARGAAAWLVLERSPASDVLAAAARLGVRCFTRTARGFAAVGDEARAPRGTPAPPGSAPG
jgi:hypothetical protein